MLFAAHALWPISIVVFTLWGVVKLAHSIADAISVEVKK
jgi:hypothetical protein